MMLNRKKTVVLGAAVVLLPSLLLAAYHGSAWVQARRFNAALAAGELAAAAGHDSPHGRFAQALIHQREREYQQALAIYAGLQGEGGPPLRNAVQFNMANIYMSWAGDARAADQPDVGMPLLEMAKQAYRDLLLRDDQFWPARFNLERALQLQPDGDEIDPQAQGMPEHSPRALGTMDAHQELP